jgi:hypothetical protein
MEPDVTFISERKIIPTKSLVIFGILALGILGAAVYGYFIWSKANVVANEEAYLAEMREIAKNTPRTFTLVPDALEVVTLPPPTPYDEADVENYKTVRAQYTEAQLNELARSSIFEATTTDGVALSAVLADASLTEGFWAIQDEITNLVIHYNEMYPEKPLFEAFPDVVGQPGLPSARYGVTIPSVYPSVAATTPYLVALYLAGLYPDQAEHYKKMGEEYAKQGIAFGWYDVESMIAAESLVTQYLAILLAE